MNALRILAVFLMVVAGPAFAAPTTSALDREKNWAEQIVDTIVVGEAVWLTNRGHRFLGLYTPPAGKSSLAVILLHGRGVHPAWGFMNRLRADLADAGVHTLSLQMPILAADAPFGSYGPTLPEAFERVETGIRYLRQARAVKRVILLGHSSGATTALGHAVKQSSAGVIGVVAIGAATYPNTLELLQPVQHLRQIRVPVLDISGSNDIREVTNHNQARQEAARSATVNYSVAVIDGADHFYTDSYELLLGKITGWLGRFKGK